MDVLHCIIECLFGSLFPSLSLAILGMDGSVVVVIVVVVHWSRIEMKVRQVKKKGDAVARWTSYGV